MTKITTTLEGLHWWMRTVGGLFEQPQLHLDLPRASDPAALAQVATLI